MTLKGHQGPVSALAVLSGEQERVVSSSDDLTLRTWDVAEGVSSERGRLGRQGTAGDGVDHGWSAKQPPRYARACVCV